MVSATAHPGEGLLARKGFRLGSCPAGPSAFLALALTPVAIVADQLASPILRTTSPLLAALAFFLFVWRRGRAPLCVVEVTQERSLSLWRLTGFLAMHVAVILLSRSITGVAQPFSGTATIGGTLVGLGKLAVLAPTFLLLPFHYWKRLVRAYGPEAFVAILLLAVNVPRRFVEFIWPSYGRMLGWVVYFLARSFVPGLAYQTGPEPTITGPLYDTGLIINCSGVDAFELLSYVFAFVTLLDWNCLRKGRAFLVYCGCLLSILVCNTIRIAIIVVLFNRGYSGFAASFHLTAGSLFFCCVFLVYVALTYRWMTNNRSSAAAPEVLSKGEF
jgi:exosortase/archaeosortase family protein